MRKKFLMVLFIGCMVASLAGCSKPLDTAMEAGNKINGEATPTVSSDTASGTLCAAKLPNCSHSPHPSLAERYERM